MNILLIGPLPDPVTGESMANRTFLNYLRKNNIQYTSINSTGYKDIQSSHGKFAFSKLLQFMKVYQNTPKIIGHKGVIYITIGQTFFGVVKYAPFIIMAVLLKKPYYLHLHGNYLGYTFLSLSGVKKKMFKWLISQGGVTSDLAWARINLAIEERNPYLVGYLSRFLDPQVQVEPVVPLRRK